MAGALWNDVRYGARVLASSPLFSLIAVSTLALGIGANTALFTVANALLLAPLPYQDSGRLALVSATDPGFRGFGPFSYPRFQFLQRNARSFSKLAAFTSETFNLTAGKSEPEQVAAARVSASFFDVLGVRPELGRPFTAEEDQTGGANVVLISHELWARRFGEDRAILGRSITLDTRPFTIIGVLPQGFQFALVGSKVEVWAPRVFDLNLLTQQQLRAGAGFLDAVGRLTPGTTFEQAQAEVEVLKRQYLSEFPNMADANPKLDFSASPLREQLVANVRPAILILFGAVALVLLIACANVASLLLSRALGRKKEIAIRTALGASRWGLARQLLVDSLLLALAGGVVGVLLSIWGTHALAIAAQSILPRADEIRTSAAALLFTLAVSVLTGILFGLVPAVELSRVDVAGGLRAEGRGAVGVRGHSRWRSGLVIGQVALSMVLLIGAGLLGRSFLLLMNDSPGFRAEGALTMAIALPPSKYVTNAQMVNFFDEVVERERHAPGVQDAAVASALPANASRFTPMLLEGQPAAPLSHRPVLALQMVSPRYFAVMGTPLLRGRAFNPHDDAQGAPVAIVNEALSRHYWPNESPVGKHILLGTLTKPAEVVGVAADIKNVTLAGPAQPEVYIPFAQRPWRNMNLILRTSADPSSLIATARATVLAVDPDQPVTAVQTLEQLLAQSRAQPRLTMVLLGVFSGAAFLLAVIGLYGTLAYSVAQRTQELGVRMALGANPRDILGLVIRQGLVLTGAGLGIGIIVALGLSRVLSSLLYRMSAADPLTFAVCAAGFLACALAAAYIPARRATQVDPAITLR